MTIDPNDPILTAYVLGELDDEQIAVVEAAIDSDATVRQSVDEIRATAAALESELRAEPAPSLTSDQRAFLESRIEPTAQISTFSIQRTAWWAGGITALAACLTVAVLFAQYFTGDGNTNGTTMTLGEVNPNSAGRANETLASGSDLELGSDDARRREEMDKQLGARSDEDAATPVDERKESSKSLADESAQELFRELEEVQTRQRSLNVRNEDLIQTLNVEQEKPAQTISSPDLAPPRPSTPPPASGGLGGGGGSGAAPGGSDGMQSPAQLPSRSGTREGEYGRARDQVPQERPDDAFGMDAGEFDRRAEPNTEDFNHIVENDFIVPRGESAVSTLSIDVDTAAYTIVRRDLEAGRLPSPNLVRIEELLNYFKYDDPAPSGDEPFAANLEVGPAPWKPEHRLVRIGLRGKEIDFDNRPPTNLVFLIDVSGSMNRPDKLPLLQKSFTMLVDSLTPDDRVAMAVYAGSSGLVLPSTFAYNREQVFHAIDSLRAGGSTNGGAGIELAYQIAQDHFIEGGINRVILATDGDFNVGVSSEGDLVRMIEEKRETGVFLSVLGFGSGNLKDAKMEQLADKGNGHYSYIDSIDEAKRVLVDELGGTLVTIAKDVKVQVEFNPAKVEAYRLIGYENRLLAREDFKDDTKDAGELGAGMNVTVLYEIVPKGVQIAQREVDELKYQQPAKPNDAGEKNAKISNELLTIKLRYKEPDGDESKEVPFPLVDSGNSLEATSDDFRFAASVATFGMLLRDSKYMGDANWSLVTDLAQGALGEDKGGSRAAFVELAKKAAALKGDPQPPAAEADQEEADADGDSDN